MDASDPIARGLPHRSPFVFVDRVLSIDPGQSAECATIFPGETPFFAGHFPGDPLVPGVILTEALAQTAGLAAGEPERSRTFHLTAIRQMKFLSPVRPSQEVRWHARKHGEIGGLLQFAVSASVESRVVAEGIIVLSETSALA